MRALTKSMVLSVVMAVVALPLAASEAPESGKDGPFGLDKVIAFYAGLGVESQTFIGGDAWKDWKERGSVVYRGMTTGFLSENVEEGSDVLANLDFRDNPNPVVCIDEFGWDYDGGKDRHTAAILQAVHRKRPRLKIAVYQMRGPVAPELAAAYRDTVELVMLETYVDLNDAWLIGFQLQAARLTGLLDRSVLALGLGAEAEDASRGLHGWEWVRTAKELDQQVRLIRMVARESPGLAFFGKFLTGERAMRMTDEELEAICSRFDEYPTDGTGLRPELLKLGKMFTKRYEGPAVFCSSEFVLPHWTYEGTPYADAPMRVTRVLMMNLGEKDAKGIKVRLRGPWEGSEVWAEGPVDIPARSLVVALLPLLPGKSYRGWLGTEIMEVDAPPGCEVFNFKDSRYHGKRESEATEEAKATKADAESAAPERPTPSMAALPTPLPEERAEAGTSPPEEWTSEKRTVTVATPDGKQEKEITYHRNTIGMEFVRIPAGEFMMGSPPGEADRDDDEGPQHRVRIAKPFYMGAHEVTQAEYEKLMGENPATFEGANNPVEEVSWSDAAEFCRRLSAREGAAYYLPTEAEWEYACRAGTTTPFYTGATISTDLANYNGDFAYGKGSKGVYRKKTTPVGSFPANSWGLYDMHGNAWERCQSLYRQHPYHADDGRENLRATGDRVLRGGGWEAEPDYCRSADRSRTSRTHSSHGSGFRVVLLAE